MSLYCQFLYMCINPFIYATTFDPVRQILFRMIPSWMRAGDEQFAENVNSTVTCLATFRSRLSKARN